MILKSISRAACALAFAAACAAPAAAQTTTASGSTQARGPSSPRRPFVVMTAQSVADVERGLHPENRVQDLIGGEGMELRVAIQHEAGQPAPSAEIHDESDDVYYVLEGSATLTLGGRLEAPKEVEPGEWRGPRIEGGKSFEVRKGDLVIVPRGTPHMRSTEGKDFAMILIKVFDKPLPAPKPAPAPAARPQTQKP
jgi:mannose-6-phosphate isomerase-like protein (cupin superfamily)